jgi:hypothetical protein
MPEFVGIGKMFAVSRHEHFAVVERGKGKMVGVALRLHRHEFVGKIHFDNIGNLRNVGQNPQPATSARILARLGAGVSSISEITGRPMTNSWSNLGISHH